MFIELSILALGAVVIALLALVPTMIVITHQQHVRIVETFGKFSTVRAAGLTFKLPWPIQSVTENISTQLIELSESVGVKSIDNAFVDVPIHVQFRIREEAAQDAYYKLANAEDQIRSYVVNQVRSTASGMSFDELFGSRDSFEKGVEETLTERMNEFGFQIENVLVDDPQPSQELRQAFDRVIASKREREAAENEAEAARVLSVGKAKAEGEALEIKGNAYATFRKTVAEGNAAAMEKFVGNTGLSPQETLNFFTSINEMEAAQNAAENGGRVLFMVGQGKKDPMVGMMDALADSIDGRATKNEAKVPSTASGEAPTESARTD